MLGNNITARDLIGTLGTDYVERIMIEALQTQNVMVLDLSLNELITRRAYKEVQDAIMKAVECGYEFKYTSATANALKRILYAHKTEHPFFLALSATIDSNIHNGNSFTKAEYDKLCEKYDDFMQKYLSMLTPNDVITMSSETYVSLTSYYTERIVDEGLLDKNEAYNEARERLRRYLTPQIDQIAMNNLDTSSMKRPIYDYLKIDERKMEISEQRRLRDNVPKT